MKTPREIAIADHLWEALERMAEEMGTERDALVNQALHALARAHGYVVPGTGPRATVPPALPVRAAAAAQVLETAERLERDITWPQPGGAGLFVVRADGAEVRVEGDRFVIGRGRSCGLVVDSGKVSREHAAVVRDGDGWAIEDLGSSNGTWYRGERIERRAIAHGDDFYVAGERLRFELR